MQFLEDQLNKKAENEIEKNNKYGKPVNWEDLIYETNRYMYSFQHYETRSFAKDSWC